KTYNTRDSLVVTDPTTSLALTGLSMGERTGSRVLQWVWSYVIFCIWFLAHKGMLPRKWGLWKGSWKRTIAKSSRGCRGGE
ncbi:hypothetical protein GE21DRAFT_1222453, partial [Neurospora crassa]